MPTNTNGKNASKNALSMRGKAIILNLIIPSKTQFVSNIFPIPKNTETRLHKLIFKYIWHYERTERISRTTLYLPNKERRIGILHPNLHNSEPVCGDNDN